MVAEYIAELPLKYDERTRLALNDRNQVIVTHPEHPALVLGSDGRWLALDGAPVHTAPTHSSC
ncbi:MAG: hypothetical protein ACR2IY_02505 [Rubrivivax sp.]